MAFVSTTDETSTARSQGFPHTHMADRAVGNYCFTTSIFFPGQLERLTAYEFASDDYYREMYGGREINHAPTMGYLIEQALLVNGVLYKKDASTFLATHRSRVTPVVINREIERGALYCTPGGIRYFGQWLIDDCVI